MKLVWIGSQCQNTDVDAHESRVVMDPFNIFWTFFLFFLNCSKFRFASGFVVNYYHEISKISIILQLIFNSIPPKWQNSIHRMLWSLGCGCHDMHFDYFLERTQKKWKKKKTKSILRAINYLLETTRTDKILFISSLSLFLSISVRLHWFWSNATN